MADWMFNRRGQACLILDGDHVRSRRGKVIGWISESNVYSLGGAHIGWFDGGVIYDSRNSALVFTSNHTGYLPSLAGLGGTPGMPGFSGVPGRPGFQVHQACQVEEVGLLRTPSITLSPEVIL